jgi:hypothetical protein
MTAKKWKSCAQWPPGVITGDNDTTEDVHDTEEQAQGVCDNLKRDGFGGLKQNFPVRTWTEPMEKETT